jgi:hypothetical protein
MVAEIAAIPFKNKDAETAVLTGISGYCQPASEVFSIALRVIWGLSIFIAVCYLLVLD